MTTCRVCKGTKEGSGDDKLIKYSARHYAHAGCALDKWGADFFKKLTPFQCGNFPYFTAKRRGLHVQLNDCWSVGIPARKDRRNKSV